MDVRPWDTDEQRNVRALIKRLQDTSAALDAALTGLKKGTPVPTDLKRPPKASDTSAQPPN